ncbi:MAG: hypothetical protein RLZZ306_3369 [Bacteroidota bacterium]|jgi:hypothetical protein
MKTHSIIFSFLSIIVFASCTSVNDLNKQLNTVNRTVTSTRTTVGRTEANYRETKNTVEKSGLIKNKSKSSGGRPKYSQIDDSEFAHNMKIPDKSSRNTRIRLAKNLAIDVEGKYPDGYSPKWRFITYKSNLKFRIENIVKPKSVINYIDKPVYLGEYNNKAVLRLSPYHDCECYADIITKDSFALITSKPQIFEVANFRKIRDNKSIGEPCVSNSTFSPKGGWAGKIKLSTDADANILMDLMLETYTAGGEDRFEKSKITGRNQKVYNAPTQVHFRYTVENIAVENEMSAKKAQEKLEAELEAKRKYADYMKKSKIQIDNLLKSIDRKYGGYDCRVCYERNSRYGTETVTNVYRSQYGEIYKDYDQSIYNTMKLENRCNQEITIIGIKQIYSEESGYSFVDVSKKLPANFVQESKEGLFESLFTSLTGLDGDIKLRKEYSIESASVNSVQWIKVVGKSKPRPK